MAFREKAISPGATPQRRCHPLPGRPGEGPVLGAGKEGALPVHPVDVPVVGLQDRGWHHPEEARLQIRDPVRHPVLRRHSTPIRLVPGHLPGEGHRSKGGRGRPDPLRPPAPGGKRGHPAKAADARAALRRKVRRVVITRSGVG